MAAVQDSSPVQRPARRRVHRAVARAAAGLLVTAGALSAGQSPALAYTRADRVEQTRYAKETMNLSYTDFLARKADFTKADCREDGYSNNGFAYPRCKKPSPYNAFNWSDDGCSGYKSKATVITRPLSLTYRNLFNKPCQLHDFGYRNFGQGLQLGRDENTRAWIDLRFLQEMQRLCQATYSGNRVQRTLCITQAGWVYNGVRVVENWNKPADMTPAPLDPDPAPAPEPAHHAPAQPDPAQPAATYAEQSASMGSPTFTNPYNASGPGPRIPAMSTVQVTCRVYAPAIASANPDGWWYRIATSPWNNQYYAVANTFWNGDIPGRKPYTHYTDLAVPVC